jgi:hypothetical protein
VTLGHVLGAKHWPQLHLPLLVSHVALPHASSVPSEEQAGGGVPLLPEQAPQTPPAVHVCVPQSPHLVTAPGEHATQWPPKHAGADPPHALLYCQFPVASQTWTVLPLHCVEPGTHVPLHAPLMHTSGHAGPAACQVPVASHVCGCRPVHLTEPGVQTPVHAAL